MIKLKNPIKMSKIRKRMRRPLIGGNDFQTSIRQGEQVQGGVMGGLPKEEWYLVCFFRGKKKRMNV
jgi:hypothetical protein